MLFRNRWDNVFLHWKKSIYFKYLHIDLISANNTNTIQTFSCAKLSKFFHASFPMRMWQYV